MFITVKANGNFLGMRRGEIYEVEVTPMIDALLDNGYLVWLDPPAPQIEDLVLTEAVKKRVTKKKDPVESAPDAGVAEVVSDDADSVQEAAPLELAEEREDG